MKIIPLSPQDIIKATKPLKYVVSYEGETGSRGGGESEPFDTLTEAERYVSEELPYGIQKCRTGSYEILKGHCCWRCHEFYEEGQDRFVWMGNQCETCDDS